jgi:hypothetical protein
MGREMKVRKFVQKHSMLHLPIMDEINFHLIVTNSIQQSHGEFGCIFNPSDCLLGEGGELHMEPLANDCYLFLHCKCVTHDFIAHETLHALHQICNRVGYKIDPENDEVAARLLGMLSAWVYYQLDFGKIAVTHKPLKFIPSFFLGSSKI